MKMKRTLKFMSTDNFNLTQHLEEYESTYRQHPDFECCRVPFRLKMCKENLDYICPSALLKTFKCRIYLKCQSNISTKCLWLFVSNEKSKGTIMKFYIV